MGLHKLNPDVQKMTVADWLIPAIIVGVSILVMFAGDAGKELLRYDRVWIGQGEFWRLISGHFAHLSWSHLALNSAGLGLGWDLVGLNFTTRS